MIDREKNFNQLKEAMTDALILVKNQHIKTFEAMRNYDRKLAEEVIENEKKVNDDELKIDEECKNMFALYNPVATDLRMVIAIMKINLHNERIGDKAATMSNYVLEQSVPFPIWIMKELRFFELYENIIKMLDINILAFNKNETDNMNKIFNLDLICNEIYKNSAKIIEEIFHKDPTQEKNLRKFLFLFSSIKKLERIGDLCKNIAEENLFYHEAKIIRHNVDSLFS